MLVLAHRLGTVRLSPQRQKNEYHEQNQHILTFNAANTVRRTRSHHRRNEQRASSPRKPPSNSVSPRKRRQKKSHKMSWMCRGSNFCARAIGGFATDTPCASAYRPSVDTAFCRLAIGFTNTRAVDHNEYDIVIQQAR